MKVSLIVCTRNPRKDFFQKCIKSLLSQKSDQKYEIIVVDNNSEFDIRKFCVGQKKIKWVCEKKVGLTAARLRGFRKSKGNLLVFVDDDNVLASNYIKMCTALSSAYMKTGVWSAEVTGKFETKAPQWVEKYFPYLALIHHTKDKTSSRPDGGTLPIGAGRVVRRSVMEAYARDLSNCPIRSNLDRRPGSLMAAGDTDIGYTALKLGYACCYTKSLKVQHLISKERLNPNYLYKLAREVSASHQLLRCIHENKEFSLKEKLKVAAAKLISPFVSKKSKYGFKVAALIGKWEGHSMHHKIYKSMRNIPPVKTSLMNKQKNHYREPK